MLFKKAVYKYSNDRLSINFINFKEKMTQVYVISGPKNAGKSTTIRIIYNMILEKYKGVEFFLDSGEGKEISVIIEDVNGKKIGLESRGDPPNKEQAKKNKNSYRNNLKKFKKKKCDIIFCTSRKHGGTVDWLNKTFKNPNPIFEPKSRSDNAGNRKNENKICASDLIKKASL